MMEEEGGTGLHRGKGKENQENVNVGRGRTKQKSRKEIDDDLMSRIEEAMEMVETEHLNPGMKRFVALSLAKLIQLLTKGLKPTKLEGVQKRCQLHERLFTKLFELRQYLQGLTQKQDRKQLMERKKHQEATIEGFCALQLLQRFVATLMNLKRVGIP